MALTKASEIDFQYPLLGFSRGDGVLWFKELFYLTRCSRVYVDGGSLIDMELIDDSLRRWIVRAVQPETPPRKPRWWHILPDRSDIGINLDLEEIEPESLDDVKRRLTAGIDIETVEAEEGFREAPDLAGVYEAINEQGTGLL
jgi:hypothetical protein